MIITSKYCSHCVIMIVRVFIGSLLSEEGKIAVASSVITFAITSIVFFAFGYFCHHYHHKQKQTLPTQTKNATPVYENVLPTQDPERDMELKENIAYGPLVATIS